MCLRTLSCREGAKVITESKIWEVKGSQGRIIWEREDTGAGMEPPKVWERAPSASHPVFASLGRLKVRFTRVLWSNLVINSREVPGGGFTFSSFFI